MTEATPAIPESDLTLGYELDGAVFLEAAPFDVGAPAWTSADDDGANLREGADGMVLSLADGTAYCVSSRSLRVRDSSDFQTLERDHNLVAASLLAVRGIPTFHGFVASTEHGSVVVMGPSGAGKTTTGLELLASGAELVADDVVAIDPDLRPRPARPHVRTVTSDPTLPVDLGGKHRVRHELATRVSPVRAALVLEDDGPEWHAALDPMQRADKWLGQRYLPIPLSKQEQRARLMVVGELAESCELFTARKHGLTPPQLADRLLSALAR